MIAMRMRSPKLRCLTGCRHSAKENGKWRASQKGIGKNRCDKATCRRSFVFAWVQAPSQLGQHGAILLAGIGQGGGEAEKGPKQTLAPVSLEGQLGFVFLMPLRVRLYAEASPLLEKRLQILMKLGFKKFRWGEIAKALAA